jgi:hypothetical protein
MKTRLLTAILFSTCFSLHAQTLGTNVNYSTGGTNVPGYTGFFNSSDGWNNSGDPAWEGQKGWTGSGSGVSSVSQVAGTTPSSPAGNGSGTLGVFLSSLPLNTTNIYLSRAFTPASAYFNTYAPFALTNTTVSLVAEWNILSFGPNEDDTFTIDLRNASDTSSLLSFTINNQGVSDPLSYNFLVSSTGTSTLPQFEGVYGGLYRIQVDLSPVGGYSGSFALIDPVTRASLSSFSLNSGTLAGGATSYDFGALRLGWELASGDVNAPGDLGFVVNEFTITSTGTVIPEPGTWVAGAFLAVAGAYTMRRRRKAAVS